MNKLISTITLIMLIIVILASLIFHTGSKTSYITMANYINLDIKKMQFYLYQNKDLKNEPQEKILNSIKNIMEEDVYITDSFFMENKLKKTNDHFVDYTKQNITKLNSTLYYNVPVDNYLCNYLLEETKDIASCKEEQDASIYSVKIYIP